VKHPDFTVRRVESFQCAAGKGQSIFWDGYAPGLGLRVTKAGSKSYVFESWLHNRSLRLTIGDTRTWPLRKAQDEATRLKALTDRGIDPRQVLREQALAATAMRVRAATEAVFVSEVWATYLNDHKNRWGPRHMADHRNLSQEGGAKKKRGNHLTAQGVLFPLMKQRLVDISIAALVEWQSNEARIRPNSARQGFELFRSFWRWACTRPNYPSFIDQHAVDSKDLRDEVPARKTKRFDVLERSHLKSWFAAVKRLSNPMVSAYLQALILTGARREEMAELRWLDVDFQWKSIWIKDKVAEEGRKIPLTPYLEKQLSMLPKSTKWVFSSRNAEKGHIAEPRIAHNRALSVAGLEHVTLHGLRRTFASLAEWVEMPRGVVAQIMGHAPNATAEKHYINRPLELLAVWHNKYEAWILDQAEVKLAKIQSPRKVPKTSAPRRLKLVSNK
jgi:integrase